jgi:cytochrome c oxidase subunit 2
VAGALGLAVALLGWALALPAQEPAPAVTRGREVFLAHGCYGCHTIGVVGTPIAPDLSRVGSRYSVATLTRWLREPSAQEPTRHMPRIELSDGDQESLAAFLGSLQ